MAWEAPGHSEEPVAEGETQQGKMENEVQQDDVFQKKKESSSAEVIMFFITTFWQKHLSLRFSRVCPYIRV